MLYFINCDLNEPNNSFFNEFQKAKNTFSQWDFSNSLHFAKMHCNIDFILLFFD